jgi:hypothetical protein
MDNRDWKLIDERGKTPSECISIVIWEPIFAFGAIESHASNDRM